MKADRDKHIIEKYESYPFRYEQAVYKKPLREHEKKPQDLSNVPGVPGVDFPIYHSVPETSFSCAHVPIHPGMYANVETGCQAYHVCHDGREGHQGASFLCTNGTLFDQTKFACDWWYNVDCSKAIEHYKLNADPRTHTCQSRSPKNCKKNRMAFTIGSHMISVSVG
ncbi:unnamed protein product [Danaus chrysippus]|uniref:(African queen) hypothetical protein n=1 Tax=Danaus chrysippus TaxID=151541 RepID=A0A8J2QI90_9NEOP|nr:unnamed protein product [Danaus chrysippus]